MAPDTAPRRKRHRWLQPRPLLLLLAVSATTVGGGGGAAETKGLAVSSTWVEVEDSPLSCDPGPAHLSLLQQRASARGAPLGSARQAPLPAAAPTGAAAAGPAVDGAAPWALIEREAGAQVRQEDAEALRESASALSRSTQVLRDYNALRVEDAQVRRADAELRREDVELRRQNQRLHLALTQSHASNPGDTEPGSTTNNNNSSVMGFVVVIGLTVMACTGFMCFEVQWMYEEAEKPVVASESVHMNADELRAEHRNRTLKLELQVEWLESVGRLLGMLLGIGAGAFVLIWWMGIAQAFMPQLLAYLYFGGLMTSCLGIMIFKSWESLVVTQTEHYRDFKEVMKPLVKTESFFSSMQQKGQQFSDRVRSSFEHTKQNFTDSIHNFEDKVGISHGNQDAYGASAQSPPAFGGSSRRLASPGRAASPDGGSSPAREQRWAPPRFSRSASPGGYSGRGSAAGPYS